MELGASGALAVEGTFIGLVHMALQSWTDSKAFSLPLHPPNVNSAHLHNFIS